MVDESQGKGSRCGVVGRHGAGRVYRRKGSSRYWIQYSVRGHQYREPGGTTPVAARKKLRNRLREAGSERFAGPAAERVTVDQLADALLVHMENQRRASTEKIRSHLKPLRAFFAHRPAIDVTTASLERYQRAAARQGQGAGHGEPRGPRAPSRVQRRRAADARPLPEAPRAVLPLAPGRQRPERLLRAGRGRCTPAARRGRRASATSSPGPSGRACGRARSRG